VCAASAECFSVSGDETAAAQACWCCVVSMSIKVHAVCSLIRGTSASNPQESFVQSIRFCRWLILGVHEPKYSSTQPSNEFATGAHLSSDIENELGKALLPSSPRTGYLGYEMISAIEPLLYQYGVDLVLTGHEHNYERSYPVYMDKVSIACLSGCVCRILHLSVCTC